MFNSHVQRVIRNKISIVTFFIILFIPMLEIAQLLLYQQNSSEVFHPAFAFYLSGSSLGHAPQIILIWFLPIYFLLLGSGDAIQDYQTGYRIILISKIGRKSYYIEKIVGSFIFSSFTMMVSLLINLIAVLIIFNGGTFSKGNLEMSPDGNTLFEFSINHPYLAIILFSIVVCFLSGLVGALGASASLFFLDRKYAYTATFFIWFLLVLRKNSVTFLVQPFSEYDLNKLLPIFFITVGILMVIPVLAVFYGVKFDEK